MMILNNIIANVIAEIDTDIDSWLEALSTCPSMDQMKYLQGRIAQARRNKQLMLSELKKQRKDEDY